MAEEQVRDWLKVQDLDYLLEILNTLASHSTLSDWEAIKLMEKLANILLELDYDRCCEEFEKAERERKSFAHDHSAQEESGL